MTCIWLRNCPALGRELQGSRRRSVRVRPGFQDVLLPQLVICTLASSLWPRSALQLSWDLLTIPPALWTSVYARLCSWVPGGCYL